MDKTEGNYEPSVTHQKYLIAVWNRTSNPKIKVSHSSQLTDPPNRFLLDLKTKTTHRGLVHEIVDSAVEDDGAAQLGGKVGGSRVGLEVREDSGGGGHGGRRRERGLVEQHLQQGLDMTVIMVCKITNSILFSDSELKLCEETQLT